MASGNNVSLPRAKCMKCREENNLLLSSSDISPDIRGCDHKFCQSCFRKENRTIAIGTNHTFSCPCCHVPLYANMQSIDEAILIGEAVTMRIHLSTTQLLPRGAGIADESIIETIKMVVNKLEAALLLNPTNFNTLYLLFLSCCDGHMFLLNHNVSGSAIKCYISKMLDYSQKLLSHSAISEWHSCIRSQCCNDVVFVFELYGNRSAVLKYSKLAYEHCLRSGDHTNLPAYKNRYLRVRAAFAKLPPLRFAVGDEVEFLHELETGSEWQLGKIVELYYRDSSFEVSYSAPYRVQLLDDDSDSGPAVYAWVKADIDRYIRKVGVRSIEDTRYQARLDAKVAELAQVCYPTEFTQNIYHTLARDSEFLEMLRSVWQIELSVHLIDTYRMLVVCRQPLIPTDSGYHVPSSEEVIAGIRVFFDPTQLSSDAALLSVEDRFSQRIRTDIIAMFQGAHMSVVNPIDENDVQGHLLLSIRHYHSIFAQTDPATTGPHDDPSVFSAPAEVSEALSKVSSTQDIRRIKADASTSYDHNCMYKLKLYLNAWLEVHICLEMPDAESACECAFIYFFVKYCLDQSMGVPKLALALYDRMNMQLSREFIRCANPTCELNRLDQSTGQVKFKLCSRCKTVIYCSRECQTAHYPEHKMYCRKPLAGAEGS